MIALKRQEEREASVLYFRRDEPFEGVKVARIGLRRGENSSFHLHTVTRDTFYVMAGRLTITIQIGPVPWPSYRSLAQQPVEVSTLPDGREIHRARLAPGDVFIIEPGTLHCAANLDEADCHFLCIEGIGRYDFVEMTP